MKMRELEAAVAFVEAREARGRSKIDPLIADHPEAIEKTADANKLRNLLHLTRWSERRDDDA